MSKSSRLNGVPESMEYQRSQGTGGVRVYKCSECGVVKRTTKSAREHTSCHPAPPCPLCGATAGRVDIGTDGRRVDVCSRCGSTHSGVLS